MQGHSVLLVGLVMATCFGTVGVNRRGEMWSGGLRRDQEGSEGVKSGLEGSCGVKRVKF